MTRLVLAFLLGLTLMQAAMATGLLMRGVASSATGGGTPVGPTCNGTIDLSNGCVQPMLR